MALSRNLAEPARKVPCCFRQNRARGDSRRYGRRDWPRA